MHNYRHRLRKVELLPIYKRKLGAINADGTSVLWHGGWILWILVLRVIVLFVGWRDLYLDRMKAWSLRLCL